MSLQDPRTQFLTYIDSESVIKLPEVSNLWEFLGFRCSSMSRSQQNVLEIKFRLTDGTDIGPKSFSPSTTIASLKESILSQWPTDKEDGPRSVKEVRLISSGRILENGKPVKNYRSSLCDGTGGVMTMHVVVQRPSTEKEKKTSHPMDQNKCVCAIM